MWDWRCVKGKSFVLRLHIAVVVLLAAMFPTGYTGSPRDVQWGQAGTDRRGLEYLVLSKYQRSCKFKLTREDPEFQICDVTSNFKFWSLHRFCLGQVMYTTKAERPLFSDNRHLKKKKLHENKAKLRAGNL